MNGYKTGQCSTTPHGREIRMAAPLTDPATIKVCIIDDHAIVRAGLRMLVESNAKMSVLWETSAASQALAHTEAVHPDVVLLDLDLGTENGLHFVADLVQKFRPCKVLVLTAIHDTQAHLAAVAAGASGVVVKEQAPETLLQAIETVHSGEGWMGRSLMAAVMGRFSREDSGEQKDPEAGKIASLTPREREIVTLVSDGFNGEKIANSCEFRKRLYAIT
jgi:DNA-binding NarL/FixJ family response regulator